MASKELCSRIEKFWMDRGNPWLPTGEARKLGFADMKVGHWYVVISEVTRLDGVLERIPAPKGQGYLYRVKQEQPVKNPTLHLPKTQPSTPEPIKEVYTRPGNVAQTPPEIRAKEPATIPVAHRSIDLTPPNTILADKLQAKLQAKDLQYEVPPTAKVTVVPPGVSGEKPKQYGRDYKQPRVHPDAVNDAPKELEEARAEVDRVIGVFESQVNPHVVDDTPPVAAAKADDSMDLEDAEEELSPARQALEEARRQTIEKVAMSPPLDWAEAMIAAAGPTTIGSALDALLAAAKPRLLDFLVDIITHPRVVHAYRPTPLEEDDSLPLEDDAQPANEEVAVQPGPAAHPRHNPVPVAPSKPVLQKVGVVGIPRDHQARQLEDQYKGKFDLRAIQSDIPSRIAMSRLRQCDRVYFLAGHSNHRLKQSMDAHRVAYAPVQGGMGALKTLLDSLN